jgi:hypothetical protein
MLPLKAEEFATKCLANMVKISGIPRNFVWRGVQQIKLRTEDRDLGAVAL